MSFVMCSRAALSKNKGVIPTSCLRMLMDVGVDLDFIELFGLLLKLSYVTFAIAFLMSLLVVLFCWQLFLRIKG